MDQLFHIISESTTLPIVTALVLGLLVALNPCIFTTNVVVLGLIAREAGSARKTFWRGVIYALGRLTMYSLLGIACIFAVKSGFNILGFESIISRYGEYILVPALIGFGLLFIFGNHLHLHVSDTEAKKHGEKMKGSLKAFVLGLTFALVFCPVSAAMYFGILLPMSVIESNGYFYPLFFSLSAGIVVAAMAWAIAFGLTRLQPIVKWMGAIQKRANLVIGILLVVAGLLLGLHILLEH